MSRSFGPTIVSNLAALADQMDEATARARAASGAANQGRLDEAIEQLRGFEDKLQAVRSLLGTALTLYRLR